MDLFRKKNPNRDITQFSFRDIEIKYDQAVVTPADLYANPFEFSVEEDKFYAFGLFKYTFGYWELMKNDLRNS